MIVSKEKITVTIAELADRLGVEYTTATGIIKFMVLQGEAEEVGKRFSPNGRGKPAIVYDLNPKFTLNFVNSKSKPIKNSKKTTEHFVSSVGSTSKMIETIEKFQPYNQSESTFCVYTF
jgi:predicted ArsR family transcriptional regulator